MLRPLRLVALLGVTLLAMSAPTVSAQDRTIEETLVLEPGGRLALESTRGSVRLTGWDQPRVDVHARIEPPSNVDDDYARRAVEGTEIRIDADARSVRIRADYDGVPRRWPFDRRLPHVHYTIQAPRQLDLDLEIDRNDDAIVRDFEGTLTIDVDRSEFEGTDLGGTITMSVDRSALTVRDVTGQVSIGIDRGRDVVLDGVRGAFRLKTDRTTVTMPNAVIEGDSTVDMDRGGIEIDLDAAQTLTLDAELSRRADFSTDLPVTIEDGGRHVRGTMNGGGPRLRVEGDRAEIRLRTHE